jgi:hypothetical protein
MGKCIARLTNWDKTCGKLGNCFSASYIVLCKKDAMDGQVICEGCMERPTEGKYQTRIFHGLLTDPIPDYSSIYGSPVFWEKLKKNGIPLECLDSAWMSAAQAAQSAGEALCEKEGYVPWKVQRPSNREIELSMARKAVLKVRERAKKSVASSSSKEATEATETKAKANPVTQKTKPLLQSFALITRFYQESEKPLVTLPTDTIGIRKETVGDREVWITDDGMVFSCDTTGEADDFIGMYEGGELRLDLKIISRS